MLESVIENNLITKLCSGESQWTYAPEITNEEKLWENFKYILEQNNKSVLDDTPLSESEFAKVRNDVSHPSFYDAGRWMVGENGKVYVHVQRGNKTLHLMVLNNEHIAGGTSVYQVINQYQSFAEDEDERDRRFDVTLLINGLPMIHIELKNKEHPYMDGFYQIKKYISEGKFRGLFSNIQMFVISNAVDTRYFAAARDTELNKKFLTGWLDHDNKPVGDYLDFASEVLKIPEAHEMVAQYTVLDNDKKKLILLRPYQIHAIQAMRDASKTGKSGFIWHTTGSGKTMTSYKATRNLLMDIPSIEKTIFLIDRKDLDLQTKMAFQSYADYDTIDVDETENVDALIKKLSDGNRQMIVTTIQKLQRMIGKRSETGAKSAEKVQKLRELKVAFVVDECHRAVTPQTKRDLERFFANSLWFGFTGTPIFEENKMEKMGDLPQTTEQLYGPCLHSYTIKEAIHDEAVLGFMVENLGNKDYEDEDDSIYDSKSHMRAVLDVILNQSYTKLGMQNPKGKTYEAILTVNSIRRAQSYYRLLKEVKEGRDELKINEKVRQAMPDFPKFAITYSVTENEESSGLNQEQMKESIDDYNKMFGTNFAIDRIVSYNSNLNDRLARKESKYNDRSQQLDLVIVVDRLLTGFDAPCLSTIYMDRKPMKPQNIIQAFSRTNRLFDTGKQYGQVVTFQAPDKYKEAIDEALRLYSRGGEGKPIAEDMEDVKEEFSVNLKSLRGLAPTAESVGELSTKQKKAFVSIFRLLDNSFAHLKAFSAYTPDLLEDYGFSQEEYEDYAARYLNVVAELKVDREDDTEEDDKPIVEDYDLVAYNRLRIDFEYIVDLLQGFVEDIGEESEESLAERIKAIRDLIDEFAGDNPKLSDLLAKILDDIESDKESLIGKDISVILSQMRTEAVETEILRFSDKWFIDAASVRYEAYNYKFGELANKNKFKESADYAAYSSSTDQALKKFQFHKALIKDFKEVLMPEISPLIG